MSIPWGILALLAIGAVALWLIADAKESVGRLHAQKRAAQDALDAIEKANEAKRDVDAADPTQRRDRLRDWTG